MYLIVSLRCFARRCNSLTPLFLWNWTNTPKQQQKRKHRVSTCCLFLLAFGFKYVYIGNADAIKNAHHGLLMKMHTTLPPIEVVRLCHLTAKRKTLFKNLLFYFTSFNPSFFVELMLIFLHCTAKGRFTFFPLFFNSQSFCNRNQKAPLQNSSRIIEIEKQCFSSLYASIWIKLEAHFRDRERCYAPPHVGVIACGAR